MHCSAPTTPSQSCASATGAPRRAHSSRGGASRVSLRAALRQRCDGTHHSARRPQRGCRRPSPSLSVRQGLRTRPAPGARQSAGQTAGKCSPAGAQRTSWDEGRHEQGARLVGAEVDAHAAHLRGCTHESPERVRGQRTTPRRRAAGGPGAQAVPGGKFGVSSAWPSPRGSKSRRSQQVSSDPRLIARHRKDGTPRRPRVRTRLVATRPARARAL